MAAAPRAQQQQRQQPRPTLQLQQHWQQQQQGLETRLTHFEHKVFFSFLLYANDYVYGMGPDDNTRYDEWHYHATATSLNR